MGIHTYAVENNDTYPVQAEVAKTAKVGKLVSPWPENPWGHVPHVPMGRSTTVYNNGTNIPGSGGKPNKGTFVYNPKPLATPTSYVLIGVGSTGGVITVP